MRNLSEKLFQKEIPWMITISIFFVFTFGVISMQIDKDGNMEDCIFTGKTMLCKMGIIEHISLWQNMFFAMPQKSLMLFVLIILLAAVLFTVQNAIGPPRLSRNDTPAQKLYLDQHPNLSFFNSLREAFSQGILNSKIYELAAL